MNVVLSLVFLFAFSFCRWDMGRNILVTTCARECMLVQYSSL